MSGDLFFWMLLVYGLTLVITGSKLTRPLRRLLKPLENDALPPGAANRPLPRGRVQTFFGTLFECPMCMGFWVGAGLSMLGAGPCHFTRALAHLRAPAFAMPWIGAAFDGLASVAACWIIHVALCKLGSQDL